MEGINKGQLMEEIRLYPAIWNLFTTDFKNKHKKVNAFKEVGGNFGLSAENSEKKYSSIRTMFGRYMKKNLLGTGKAKKTEQDIFYESLVWLKQSIKMKTTIFNFSFMWMRMKRTMRVLFHLLKMKMSKICLMSRLYHHTSVVPSEPGTNTNRGKKRKSDTEDSMLSHDLDEMTLYFLSIAKRMKKLPVAEQRKIRFDLETMRY